MTDPRPSRSRLPVDLFIPCLVDQFLPEVGAATVQCLRATGCEVRYDPGQTCCGQVFQNSGQGREARAMARAFVRRFADAEVVVGPSWSCVEMVRDGYREVLDDPGLAREWEALRPRVHEVVDYLARERGLGAWPGRMRARAVLHWSCHMPRNEAVRRAAEGLLASILDLLPRPVDECCGFGGVFMARWREVSASMGRRRLATLTREAPDLVVVGEPGCLLQLRGVAPQGVRVLHVTEVLAASLRGES